jgi:hypothetical protein
LTEALRAGHLRRAKPSALMWLVERISSDCGKMPKRRQRVFTTTLIASSMRSRA